MIISVSVKPNSKEEKLEKISDFEYKISVKKPAERGRANARVINLISKEFGVSFKDVKIKTPSSRKKIVEIRNKS